MKQAYLLAAGFSYQFGMPLVKDLTEVFFSIFDKEYITIVADGLAQTFPYGPNYPLNRDALFRALEIITTAKENQEENYEQIINRIKELFRSTHQPDLSRSYSYIFSVCYGIIHDILVDYQEFTFNFYQIKKEPYKQFKNLISQDAETWVFTLNHDLFMEFIAKDFGIPITFGDKHEINFRKDNKKFFNTIIPFTYSGKNNLNKDNPLFFKGKFGINLVKLHGGLNELKYKDGSNLCNLTLDVKDSSELMENFKNMMDMRHYLPNGEVPKSAEDWVITNMDNELDIATKSMLTGGDKYSISFSEKDGEEKLILFSKKIEELELLTIIGYGFNDRHINNRIYKALILNPSLKIKIVNPYAEYPDCLLEFKESITLIRADVANWIYFEEHSTPTKHNWNPDLQSYNAEIEKLRPVIKSVIIEFIRLKYRLPSMKN